MAARLSAIASLVARAAQSGQVAGRPKLSARVRESTKAPTKGKAEVSGGRLSSSKAVGESRETFLWEPQVGNPSS